MSLIERVKYWCPALGWMAVIFYQSSRTGGQSRPLLAIVGHFTEYFILAILLGLGLLRTSALRGVILGVTIVTMGALYGVSDEIHQLFVPGRQSDPMDVVVDLIGALVGVLVVHALAQRTSLREIE